MTDSIKKSEEKEPGSEKGTAVPYDPDGMGTRIARAIELAGGSSKAAATVGVSPESLRRYSNEAAKPTFEAICRLAHASGVSMKWLATGQGDSKQSDEKSAEATLYIYKEGLDPEMVRRTIEIVDSRLGEKLNSKDKAAFIVDLLLDDQAQRKADAQKMLKEGPPQPD